MESATNTTFANRISINPVLETVTGNNTGAGVEAGDPATIAGKPVGSLIWLHLDAKSLRGGFADDARERF